MADLPTNAEEVKQVVADVLKPEGFPGEFTLGDGTVVKASNWEEAFQKVADMKVNTATALRDRERQIEELRQVNQPQPASVPETSTTGFDQKKYWELMNNDPLQAQQYIDAARFGVTPDQVPGIYKEVLAATQYSGDRQHIETFMSENPDYPGTTEAFNKIWGFLSDNKFPVTAINLDYAYMKLVKDGEITPLQEAAPQPWVPPNMRGGGTQPQQGAIDPFEGVPDDKLDEVAKRVGLWPGMK